MPRITKPTLAEHRSAQMERLSRLALGIVTEHGPAALTLGSLAKQAGLSRPSLYVYFSSRDDLVAHLCERGVTRWVQRIVTSMQAHIEPHARVHAFIDAQLLSVGDADDEAVLELVGHGVSAQAQARLDEAQAPLVLALHRAVDELGIGDASLVGALVQGLVAAGHDQIRNGADPVVVVRTVHRFADGGLDAHRRATEPAGGADERDDGEQDPGRRGGSGAAVVSGAAADRGRGSLASTPRSASLLATSSTSTSMTHLFARTVLRPHEPAAPSRAPGRVAAVRVLSVAMLVCTAVSITLGLSSAAGAATFSWFIHMGLGLTGAALGILTAAAAHRAGVANRSAAAIAGLMVFTVISPVIRANLQWWFPRVHELGSFGVVVGLVLVIRMAWKAPDPSSDLSGLGWPAS